ncbi:hypothetical protein MBUL_02857 [Methylobacterium bullatum]|uniref:DUF1127 domain-containing protein n=1 Tax=Methylobacterium bullatum TaxID=570505 RepID=A0A679J9Z0_9HYPH|nr:hypothetical protein MBUL_02857 [Methylobacterium bullatum]
MPISDNLSANSQPLARPFDALRHPNQPFPVRAIALLSIWYRRAAGRRTIRELTSEQVKALDLDPVALRAEAAKPFWRA